MLNKIKIDELLNIASKAGNEILKIYNQEFILIDRKEDNSPLTLADKASHEIIYNNLTQLFPDIPIISEEGEQFDYEQRKMFDYFWLVDPLDGTKEFINKNGEFTVNIALIEKDKPVLGVIYAPVLDRFYYGSSQIGTFRINNSNALERLNTNPNAEDGIIIVKSRSHSSADEEEYLKKYTIINSISVGSSLKFCMVAEGKAHLYYRHGPTMEWDTAAGHAIAEYAGAKITGLTYNKVTLKNDSFLVTSIDHE